MDDEPPTWGRGPDGELDVDLEPRIDNFGLIEKEELDLILDSREWD